MGTKEVGDIIDKFNEIQREDLEKAVKFVTRDPSIARLVFSSFQTQSTSEFFQPLFEWLYKCIQLKSTNKQAFYFCLQFTPELVVVYLQAVYEDIPKLKANAEVLLSAILSEVEKEKQQTLLQVPTLSKSSVYHQCPSQLAQLVLTEAVLQLHNEVETIPNPQYFTGKTITVNNRLQFLSAALDAFCDHIMIFSGDARDIFCQCCIRLALQGMRTLGPMLDPFLHYLPENLKDFSLMKRISVNDNFIMSLLRGIRICLFQSCHVLATNALQAVKIRAEYELLTKSIQISHTLSRLVENVQAQNLKLNVEQHSSYHGPGSPAFNESPANIHCSLNSFILHHNLSVSKHSLATPHTKIYSKTTAV